MLKKKRKIRKKRFLEKYEPGIGLAEAGCYRIHRSGASS